MATCYVVSALICFDLSWILIGTTSLWAGIDSKKIGLYRYKIGISCRPASLFCCCYLLWVFVFPWHLWARFKINAGEVDLKVESPDNAGAFKRFFRKSSDKSERIVGWLLIGIVGFKIGFLIFCIEESWRGPRAWENYKQELAAKGESFDYDAMIPPPVPDSQNFFSAPMMSTWFIRPSEKVAITEDLSKRLTYTNTTLAVVIFAEALQSLPCYQPVCLRL